MWNISHELPAERSIFLVRKWVGKSDDAGVSFIAKIPDNHIRHMAPHLQFEPGVGVVMGSVRDGRFFDECGNVDISLNIDAILAWTSIPDEYLKQRDVACQTAADLILKVSR